MKHAKWILPLLCCCIAWACRSDNSNPVLADSRLSIRPDSIAPLLDPAGQTVAARFPAPAGFKRLSADSGSFATYLRGLPLRPAGSPVHLYDGLLKARTDVHCAVVDLDVGPRNLQQCADAIIRLRAEYLFRQKRYGDIRFKFTNGFVADYSRWRGGERIRVSGNRAWWVPGEPVSGSYASFRKYLDVVFTYAGTASLERELLPVDPASLQPGDVWIEGGHPGHAVIVLDVVVASQGEERQFLLAQSYMPAQEIHVLRNPANPGENPWYSTAGISDVLETPEWTFCKNCLRRFR